MFARRVAVVGTGYVGLTTGACLASLGHRVVCADIDEAKVEALRRGEVDPLEPDLAELVTAGLAAGRLSFVVSADAALTSRGDGPVEVVFLCLPTPMGVGGVADLTAVEASSRRSGTCCRPARVVVNKSTVPVGTARRTAELLGRDDVAVVSNPEFLREGSAVRDFLNPDRIVVGSDTQDAAERVAALYARLGAPTVLTDAASAEMSSTRRTASSPMKLSYVNALAELCERVAADIDDVTEGMGYDHRIGQSFLTPGPGWGGSCLPKDTHALLQVADVFDFEFRLLRASIETNLRQRQRMVDKVRLAVTGSRTGSLSHTPHRPARPHLQGGHRRPARLPRHRRRRPAAAGRSRARRVRPGGLAGLGGTGAGRHRGRRRPGRPREERRCPRRAHRVAGVPHARLARPGPARGAAGRRRHPQHPRRRRPRPRRVHRARSRTAPTRSLRPEGSAPRGPPATPSRHGRDRDPHESVTDPAPGGARPSVLRSAA